MKLMHSWLSPSILLGSILVLLSFIQCFYFKDYPTFIEILDTPEIRSIQPDLIAPPLMDPLVVQFPAVEFTESYELYIDTVQLAGEFVPADVATVPAGETITFTVYPEGHELYNDTNDALMDIPASVNPKSCLLRACNQFQCENSEPLLVDFCKIDRPVIKGFRGSCDKTPCRNQAVVFLMPMEWFPTELTYWYDYEIYEADPAEPNSFDSLQQVATEISEDLWKESFDEEGNIIIPPLEPEIPHTYPLVGYGRTTNTYADLTIPYPENPNFQALYPGSYYIRVRSFNTTCYSSWSEPFLFHFYEGWSANPRITSLRGSLSQVEGIAIDEELDRLYVGNNGGVPHDSEGLVINGVGRYNVQTIRLSTFERYEWEDNTGVFGYQALLQDPFGNNIDGLAVGDKHDIFVASDQTGYIYHYNREFSLLKRMGSGVQVPHNPETDTLFWGIAYYDNRIYALDANDYDDGDFHERYLYVYDAETGEKLDTWHVADKLSNKSSSELWGIAIDPCNELIYIADNDYNTKVVRVFNLHGEQLMSFGAGMFGSPIGITVGCNGIIYVVDGYFAPKARNVTVFPFIMTPLGPQQLSWESEPIQIGSGLYDGRGCTIDRLHNLYVANNQVIYKYTPD